MLPLEKITVGLAERYVVFIEELNPYFPPFPPLQPQ